MLGTNLNGLRQRLRDTRKYIKFTRAAGHQSHKNNFVNTQDSLILAAVQALSLYFTTL